MGRFDVVATTLAKLRVTNIQDDISQIETELIEVVIRTNTDIANNVDALWTNVVVFVVAFAGQKIAGVVCQHTINRQGVKGDRPTVQTIFRINNVADEDIPNSHLTTHLNGERFNVLQLIEIAEFDTIGQFNKRC